MDYQALGQRIKQHRKWLMLTQEQAASAAELSTSFYGHIERGTRVASIATLLSISHALETTPDALLLDFLLQVPKKGAIKKHNNGYIQAVAQFFDG